jgi:hypothetical protein
MVKREFLAGFQGGDGSRIKYCESKQLHIQIASTSKSVIKTYESSLIDMMSQIVKIFRDLHINVFDTISVANKQFSDIMIVSYSISNERCNLIENTYNSDN